MTFRSSALQSRVSRHFRRPLGRRAAKLGIRAAHELIAPLRVRRFGTVNSKSSSLVTGDAPAIVSLTTFGSRLSIVHIAIESIARGVVRPSRIILWLDDDELMAARPQSIRRLEKRGLEVKLTEKIGPHAKYFPAVQIACASGLALVTADDDIIYPRRWLAGLLEAHYATPENIVCYQSHRVSFTESGYLAPYADWAENWSDLPTGRAFALGVSGVLYPPRMLEGLRAGNTQFMSVAPRADDVWLHYVAAVNRISVRQISNTPTHFTAIRHRGQQLKDTNVGASGNDRQIAATYDAGTLEWIRSQT